jgi:hypothetical protein
MANVKLVVIYPRPKDIEAFEKVYQNEHVPLAVAKLGGKTKIVATKVLASPQGYPSFLPHCGDSFLVDAGSGSVCGVRWREGGPGPRGFDFFRGTANFLGSRRRNVQVRPNR